MIELSVEASGVKGKPLFTRVVMAGSRASLQSIVWPGVTAAIRRTMQGNRGKDTVPELALRSLVHAIGYRYWTHVRSLPGSPDLVFTARRKVVWLHGCFWHSHSGCKFATKPRIRAEYWGPKLARNQERDAELAGRLHKLGWQSIVVWECEMRDLDAVRTRLCDFLGPTRFTRNR